MWRYTFTPPYNFLAWILITHWDITFIMEFFGFLK